MNFFHRIDDLSFIKYSSNYKKAENSSLSNWFESISLDYACVCFSVSTLHVILHHIRLILVFGKFAGCMVAMVELLSIHFYRLDLKFSSILIYFMDMIVI